MAEIIEESPIADNNMLQMINFEKQMFMDILEHDGLMICAKGFNERVIVTNLLRAHSDPSNLVLVINSADFEEKYYMTKLKLSPLPILSAEREKAYLNGGIHFVSTRVLVVDLLRSRVPVEHITGIIVLRGHSILESCQEAFVLRLFRQKNKTGFIKAFSHSAERFTFGYAQVEKVMRNLFVKELFLWPRFHALVKQDLEQVQTNVIELHVPLPSKTALIQSCILDIMNYTSKELKRINRHLDLQEITVENCLVKKFHKILQSQLDTVWHQLSTRTKELIQDLKIMRSLIISLIHQDAVSFYCLVRQYRSPEYAKVNSGWILLDSAEQLFKYSQTRVFNMKKEFEPEIYSKWKYLSEILTVEIPEERKKATNSSQAKILILCNDARTCKHLNQYLTMGAQAFMYLSALRNELDIPVLSKEYQSFKNTYKHVSKEDANVAKKSTANVDEASKTDISDSDSFFSKDELDDCDLDKTQFMLTMSQTVSDKQSESISKIISKDETFFEPFTQLENMDLTGVGLENPVIYIQTFKNCEGGICLEDTLRQIRPNYVIMYHSDITATRQIELYSARKDASFPPLTVYILVHANTTEEQAYLISLKREKQAFELLIQTKSTIVIPTYQDGKTEMPSGIEVYDSHTSETNTRRAGGQDQSENQEKPRVIVDVREFRSDLPALLHKKGIDTVPVTISIGDYILTPDICVERKSLSDLIGSLNSGRLYTQCTQMCRNYSRPMLLIEFDQNRPFQLQGHYVVSNDISGVDVQQKLQLLTLHFPRLKLIWSPSPFATADLFCELKSGRPQPNAVDASSLGEEAGVETLLIERFNPRIHDFLLKLPGVNSKNISRLMNRGISLDNLIKLKKDELDEILGNKIDAEMLWSILHSSPKPLPSSNDPKIKKNRFGKPMRGKRF